MESEEVRLARELFQLDKELADLAAKTKALNERYEAKEAALIQCLVENGKTGTGHIEGIGTFALRRENFPSVTKANMPHFLSFVRAAGDGGMIEETIPASTLKAYCKDRLNALAEKFIEDPAAADEAAQALKLPADEVLAPAELAKRWFAQYGVQTFSKIQLSITKKGK